LSIAELGDAKYALESMLLPPSKEVRLLIEAAWRGAAPDTDLDKLVEEEPDLSRLLLKTANARNRTAGREMFDPKRAILHIGTTSAGHIALTNTLLTNLTQAKVPEEQRSQLWEDCIHRGSAAMILAGRYSEVHPDAAFATGMCLEFGKLRLLEQFMDRGYEFERIRRLSGQERIDAEEEFFQTTHVEAFLKATEHWKLPKPLLEAVECHHKSPEEIAKIETWRLSSILRWSDTISEVLTAPDIEAGLNHAVGILAKEAALGEQEVKGLVDKIALQSTESAALMNVPIQKQLSLDVRVQRTRGQNRPESMPYEDLLVFAMALRQDKERLEAEIQGLRVELHTVREFDALTSLPNRRRFMAALRKEIGRSRRYNRPLSVVFVDIDDFTELNARFGQEAGDDILKKCANTLSRVVRDVDFLARVGGDEFAAILPETDRGGGPIVAERARAAIEAIRVSVKDQLVRISATAVGASLSDLPPTADHDDIHGVVTRQLRRLHSRGGNRASWVEVDPVSAARARNKK